MVQVLLKDLISTGSLHPSGQDTVQSLHNAHICGCVIGQYGPATVAQMLSKNLPVILSQLTCEQQAQQVGYCMWMACCISQIFNVRENEISRGHIPRSVEDGRRFGLLFLTELLERQSYAPSHLMALPLSFFNFLSSDPTILTRFGSTERVANALRRINALPLCASLWDWHAPEKALSFYNNLS
jgi:hypothetical protein